jgi:hypothetical protein
MNGKPPFGVPVCPSCNRVMTWNTKTSEWVCETYTCHGTAFPVDSDTCHKLPIEHYRITAEQAAAIEALRVAAQAMVRHPLSESPSEHQWYREHVKLWHALADALRDLEGT